MSRRRGRIRRRVRRMGPEGLVAVGLLALVVFSLVTAAVSWLAAHPWVLALLVLAAGGGGALWWRYQRERRRWERVHERALRLAIEQLDGLHHRQFEFAVRDLLRRDGCQDAQQVGGRGDNGADVKATDPFGRRWVIQCKHRKAGWEGAAVGTPALQVLNGTGRQIHGGDVLVMLTNGRFSKPASGFAQSQRLHLVDRRMLAQWASGSRPLWELLQVVPPPRRPSSFS